MLTPGWIAHVDMILQQALGIKKPFANKHVIFIGDLYQLPTVLECQHARLHT